MTDNHEFLTPDVRFHLIRKMERHKIIGLSAAELLAHEQKYLELHGVAGVILFDRNVQSFSQIGELVASVCEEIGSEGMPPLVMADHEGDLVSELRAVIGAPPSPLAIAATGDVDLAREVARETGQAMRKMGVNAVLAPVADCFLELSSPITGLRTFGHDPERVAAFVEQTIAGFHEAGVLACVKHFPGHGDTPEDSHETLPEVARSLDDLRAVDLVPFSRAVAAGTDMVMMSHVAYPMGRDALVPASFDARIIGGLLRDEMHYDGVVITDALEMAGARWYAQSRFGSMGGGFERSLLAGADLLLHTRPIPEQVQVDGGTAPVLSINVMDTIIKTLEKVVDRGRIDEKLSEAAEDNEGLRNILGILERSTARVVALRERAGVVGDRPRSQPTKVISFDAYPSVPSVYRGVAERAVASPSPWQGIGMLKDKRVVVLPVLWSSGDSLKRHDLEGFVDGLVKHLPGWERAATVVDFDSDGDGQVTPHFEREAPTVMDASRYVGGSGDAPVTIEPDEEIAIVYSARGCPPEAFTAALQAFAEGAEPGVVIVAGWPLFDWIPDGVPTLASLGASPQAAAAVAQILLGAAEPAGSLDGLLPLP